MHEIKIGSGLKIPIQGGQGTEELRIYEPGNYQIQNPGTTKVKVLYGEVKHKGDVKSANDSWSKLHGVPSDIEVISPQAIIMVTYS